MKKLINKVVVITGASSGIGAAAARKLVKLGSRVVLAARREEKLRSLVTELGDNAIYVQTDVTRKSDLDALMAATVKKLGKVDVFWNNAGVMPISFFEEGRTDDWNRMIDINVKGVLYGINAVLPYMLEQGSGHIVGTASVQAYKTLPGTGVYAATKFAVRAIMDTLREELAGKIKVTTLYPGLVATEFGNEMPSPKVLESFGDLSKLPQLDAEAIADAFIYAISQPDNVTASDITIRPLAQTF